MKKLILWGQPLINRVVKKGAPIVATHNVTEPLPPIHIVSIDRIVTGTCEYPQSGTCVATSQYEVMGTEFTAPVTLVWSVSAGATITAGQGTKIITVTTDSNTNTTYDVTCVATDISGSDTKTETFTDVRTEQAPPVGTTWTLQDTGYTFALYSVAGNANIITALPASTSGAVYSLNGGVSWQSGPAKPNIGTSKVVYANGRFVAVGDYSGSAIRASYSNDGITWLPGQGAASNNSTWPGLCYGNGQYVAVNSNNIATGVMTSPDGITWTSQTCPINRWANITYGNGIFVAVAKINSFDTICTMTSPDGINWTLGTQAPHQSDWGLIQYGNGVFSAVSTATDGETTKVMTSTDGINWTENDTGLPYTVYRSMTYTNGLFVAVGSNRCMTSPDGITWTSVTVPSGDWTAVSYVPEQNKAVSVSTTASVTTRAMTSP